MATQKWIKAVAAGAVSPLWSPQQVFSVMDFNLCYIDCGQYLNSCKTSFIVGTVGVTAMPSSGTIARTTELRLRKLLV